MQLPHPSARLAGCCWLPRFAAKTRVALRGGLPLSYRVAFGSRLGVDGYFFRHFQLSLPHAVAAVRRARDDDALAAWFLKQPGVTPDSIAAWNTLAPRLGAPGQPARATLHIVRWFLYPRIALRRLHSLFHAIELDERLAPPPGSGASPP